MTIFDLECSSSSVKEYIIEVSIESSMAAIIDGAIISDMNMTVKDMATAFLYI